MRRLLAHRAPCLTQRRCLGSWGVIIYHERQVWPLREGDDVARSELDRVREFDQEIPALAFAAVHTDEAVEYQRLSRLVAAIDERRAIAAHRGALSEMPLRGLGA